MTTTLDSMKRSITNALEKGATETTDVMKWYYGGKVFGILEVASSGVLSETEYAEFIEHYESENERFS